MAGRLVDVEHLHIDCSPVRRCCLRMVEISSWVFRPVLWVSPGGTSEVGRRRRLWTLIVCVAALNLVAMCPFLVLSPLIAQQKLRGAAAWSAIAFGCAADSMRGSALVMRMHPAHPSAPLSSAPWHSLLPLPTRGLPPRSRCSDRR